MFYFQCQWKSTSALNTYSSILNKINWSYQDCHVFHFHSSRKLQHLLLAKSKALFKYTSNERFILKLKWIILPRKLEGHRIKMNPSDLITFPFPELFLVFNSLNHLWRGRRINPQASLEQSRIIFRLHFVATVIMYCSFLNKHSINTVSYTSAAVNLSTVHFWERAAIITMN